MNNWQRDPRWGNIKLGFSNTYIKDYGCTISAIGNVIGVTPDVVNERLKAVNGFAYGNLVIWAAIEKAFPGIKVKRVQGYNNTEVAANVPNTIVEVPAQGIGGSGKHWVQFIGGGKNNDPWTGRVRPNTDFTKYGNLTGYALITGKWGNPYTPPADDILLNKIRTVVNDPGDARTKISKIRAILK